MTTAVPASFLMDRMYRHQRHVYDLTRKFYLLGRDRLIAGLRPRPSDCVLEIGCGTGRNLIQATRCYPDARFFGIDVSSEMLSTAQAALTRASLAARVTLHHADATGFDAQAILGRQQFERVYFSYTLSMIPDWQAALRQALAILPPGGELHIADFGGQERLPAWFRTGLRRWLALFHVTPRDGLEAALTSLAAERRAHVSVERPFLGYCQLLRLTMPAA